MSFHLDDRYGNLVLKLITMLEEKILSLMRGLTTKEETWNHQLRTLYWNMQKIEADNNFSLKLSSGFSELASFITKTSVRDLLDQNSKRLKRLDLRMYEIKQKKQLTPILTSNPSKYHINHSQRNISPEKPMPKPRKSPAVRYKKVSPNYYKSIMNLFLSEFRSKPEDFKSDTKFAIQTNSQTNPT